MGWGGGGGGGREYARARAGGGSSSVDYNSVSLVPYGEPFVSIDAHNRSIDAHIPVRMRKSSVFLNMSKIMNKNVLYIYLMRFFKDG